ncbi:MAG: hypothetical protein ACJ74O_03010 [Frankiaceae bacterium]
MRTAIRAITGLAVVLIGCPLLQVAAAPLAAAAGTTVLSWGDDSLGQLGDGGAATGRLRPGPGPQASDVVAVAGGRGHVLALRAGGTVLAWGQNDFGQVGDGTTTNRGAPITVAGPSGVTAVFTGHYHSMALDSAGALWSWGDNADGQLGLGDRTSRSTATRIPGLSGIVAADGGADHSVALASDGTVWAWGSNAHGEVGDGTTTLRASPVHVPGLSGIVAVAAARNSSYAVTSTGAAYAWGRNDYGQLGLGDTTLRTRPTLIPGLSGVRSISAGAFHAVASVADGTVRAWGFNSYGNVGDGSTTKRLSPVVVPGLSGVSFVETGRDYSFAVTGDGALRAWGRNDFGQLGDGTTTDRHSPVTVAGATGVQSIAAGRDYAAVLTGGAPDTVAPDVPGQPTATSPSAGTVRLVWAASSDDRATTLTYYVYRDGGATAIGSVASASTTTVAYTDGGLAGGSVHAYRVQASDGTNRSGLSAVSNQVTVQSGSSSVLSDDFSGGLGGWSATRMTLDSSRFPPAGSAPSVRAAPAAAAAYATTSLPGTYSAACVSADIDLQSLSTTAVLLRLRSASAGVARAYLTSTGYLAVRADPSGLTSTSTTKLPLGSWHSLRLCVTVGTGGTAGTVTLSLDGAQVRSLSASTGTAPVAVVQLGDTAAATLAVNYDDVVVTN